MPEISKVSQKDIPLIRALCFQIWPQTYSHLLSREQIDYMLDMMYSPASLQKQMEEDGCVFIIVYNNLEPIAFASFNEYKPRIWKLHKIYVLPDQQGKGIGRLIINYIIAEITPKNAKGIQLQVNRENKAKNFYEKLGFTIIETANFDIGGGYFMKDYIMELVL